MRAVDILWRMAYGPKGGGSPTPPTPSGTVIFDGDVEWTYNDEFQIWMATFIPENEPSGDAHHVTLMLNGSDIDGVSDGTDMGFPDLEEPVAQVIYDEPNWMIGCFLESKPDAHIKILQETMQWYPLYTGTVSVIYQDHDFIGAFLSDANIKGGEQVRGTVNGVSVSGTFDEFGSRCDFDGTTMYVFYRDANESYYFGPGEEVEADFALDLEYYGWPPESE